MNEVRKTKKYIAYSCTRYKQESLQKIVEVLTFYNHKSQKNIELLLSGVLRTEYCEYKMALNIGYGDLSESEYIDNIAAFIIDDSRQLEKTEILNCLAKGISCIVNEQCREMKEICTEQNCGLYYADKLELLAVLSFLLDRKNAAYAEAMGKNAHHFADRHLLKSDFDLEVDNRIKNRKQLILNAVKEQKGRDCEPDEKTAAITSSVKRSDRKLLLVCSDDLSKNYDNFLLLIIYQYIKLYINPNADLYIPKADRSMERILYAQMKELDIRDVIFYENDTQFSANAECDRILLAFEKIQSEDSFACFHYVINAGFGRTHGNVIRADRKNAAYLAEMIGLLLYGQEK